MNIIEFESKLAQIVLEKQAENLLSAYLKTYGIHAFAFTYYSGHVKSGSKLRYEYASDALRPWHTYYLEQAYANVDRTLEENHNMTLPLYWEVQEQFAQAKNKREQRIRQESMEFGIDKGLSIPVHGPNHDFATLTLHQFRHEENLKDYLTHQFEWLSATQVFYHHIKRILDLKKSPHQPFKLTRREAQCLALTAKMWRVEQIAKELKITPSTVNFHIQNANKKMGTNNKYQATYKYFQLI